MTDWLSREQRSRNMSSIRSAGNLTTERKLAKLLRAGGLSGWRRHEALPGKPDFVFKSHRLAIFVDGCFWHGCPRCYRLPEDNRDYWKTKLLANRCRDKRVNRKLRSAGWTVVRCWEHALETERGQARVLAKLRTAMNLTCAETK